jgi:hypothetical protein
MADELKTFEQTHWLRERAAITLCYGEVTDRTIRLWAEELSRTTKNMYRVRVDKNLPEFKAAVEAAQRGE